MDTIKNLSGTQKFLIGLLAGLIVGWGGTIFALNKNDWGVFSSCLPGESKEACDERIAEEDLADDAEDTDGTEEDDEMPAGTENVLNRPDPVVVSGTNAIAVDDQVAGSLVEVTMVTLSTPGWVVVHEDSFGTPGRVLGARRYDPGIYLGEVELLRPTVSGQTYYGMLHLDDGDRQFDLEKDAPMKSADGNVIMDSFKAQ